MTTTSQPDVEIDPRLGYAVFDADNHYYEAVDALTRHLPKEFANRGARWIDLNGRKRLMLGAKLFELIPNPTFDPIGKPGALYQYFKGVNADGADVRTLVGDLEKIRPEYRDRDVRLAVMNDQGVGAAWFFPTLSVGLEVAFQPDIRAALATFSAFNRWLDDDWGFAYQDRIFSAPYLSLSDVDWAVRELEWCISRGARVITMRNGTVYTAEGTASPADERFDPFWARVEEAGIVMAPHAGDDGYDFLADMWESSTSWRMLFNSPLKKAVASQRAVPDFYAAIICHRLFERFPGLRFASIENGGAWVAPLLARLHKGHTQTAGWYKIDPVEQFREHVWITPFWEDNVQEIARTMPAGRLLFGSDWPHLEGVAQPLDFLTALEGFDAADRRRIMRDNAAALTAAPR
ncbi:amidohydrolase 2 [Parafrankia sp. EAN1pec]|uniref:amidohydrolase family protein n=1 Tax=Parafrankia sp. (strain EAN1pec) TaxID=298653 RepID=UPI0000544D8C|nr:amidohydrolase 2 [Frankia sp. EAN1pec]